MNNKQELAQNKKTDWPFLLLLLGLLLLRFPFDILSQLNKLPISQSVCSDIFREGTYLITAILIVLKRDFLIDYNIGFGALLILIFAPIAKLLSQYFILNGFLQHDTWFEIAVAICLSIALAIFRPKLRKRSFKEILLWLFISVFIGICSAVLMGSLLSVQNIRREPVHSPILLIAFSFITQLGNAAIMEEPLFRGFLWGFLRSMHWKDIWIWLFQAVLFWLGHIYYFGVFNYSFWIIVPVGSLIFGLLAWRSRSIGTSMIAHGLINSLGSIVASYTW